MAYIEFTDGRRELHTKPDQVKRLFTVWRIMVGALAAPDPKTAIYAKSIKKIKFNYREAPDDYIRWNLNEIVPQALQDWAVDPKGHPVRPASNRAWEFAKKYGLWKSGKPTPIVTGRQAVLL